MKIIEDKVYMQFYWDLASEVEGNRTNAAYQLVKYVQNLEQVRKIKDNESKYQTQKEYIDYSLKRLIRGMGSPRDHARQGFAIAFCELIRVFNVDSKTCITLMDENLQVTGASKGSEERDIMFGKLFGYIGLIRGGLLKEKSPLSEEIIERLLTLHGKKSWLQELTVEAFLIFLTNANDELQKYLLQKLEPFYIVSLDAMNANQLLLFLGLQYLSKVNKNFEKLWKNVVKTHNIELFDFNTKLDVVSDALLSSSRTFPKIHRIWDYLLGLIVPLSEERELIQINDLSSEQQSSLKSLIDFIDAHMWTTTKEKRALAMKLCVKIVSIVSADSIPIVVSNQMIQSILSSRTKKNNLLYNYTGVILEELVAAIGTKHDRLLALITILTHVGGGGNFDSRTNTNTLQNLVKSMDVETIQNYFHLLSGIIGKPIEVNEKGDNEEEEENEDTMEVEEEKKDEATSIYHHPSIDALQSMISLSKHSNLTDPNVLFLPTTSILLRLSCFTTGKTNNYQTVKTEKKDKKKDKKDSKKKNSKKEVEEDTSADSEVSSQLVSHSIESVQTIEKTLFDEEENENIPEEINQFAKEHLMNYVHNSLNKLSTLSTSSNQQQKGEESKEAPSSSSAGPNKTVEYLKDLWTIIGHFFESSLESISSSNNSMEVDGEQEVDELSSALLYKQMNEIIQFFFNYLIHKDLLSAEKKKHTMLKFSENAVSLLMTVFIYHLLGHELEHEIVLELPNLLKNLLENSLTETATKSKKTKKSQEDDDDDDEEEDPLEVRLLDFCIELLAMNNEQSLKGARDVIKRLWNNIFLLLEEEEISQQFFDVLIDSVARFEDSAAPEGEGEGEENEDDADDDEEEEEEEEEQNKKKRKVEKSKKDNKKSKKSAEAEEDEHDDEDIMVSEEDMLDLLLTEEDGEDILMKMREGHLPEQEHPHHPGDANSDDEEMDAEERAALLHFEGADEALVKMIKLRQESRKKGLLNMKKQQLLLKSRVLDILEVCIHRLKSSSILFSFFTPLLQGYVKCITSNLTQEIQEGKAFTVRLYQLIINELCKKKILFHFDSSSSDDLEELQLEFVEEMKELIPIYMKKLFITKISNLKTFGQETFYWILKIIFHALPSLSANHQKELSSLVITAMTSFINAFAYKKFASSLPVMQSTIKFFEELFIHRFSSFFLYHHEGGVSSSVESNKTPKKSKKNSAPAAAATSTAVSYPIWQSLIDGLKGTKSFVKKLQFMELIQNITTKQFQLFENSSKQQEQQPEPEEEQASKKKNTNKKQDNNKDSSNNQKNNNIASVEEQLQLKEFLQSNVLPAYFFALQEIVVTFVALNKEKFGLSSDATATDSIKLKKEFDTKNIRSFMNLLSIILNWIEDKKKSNPIVLKTIQNEVKLLSQSMISLQSVYEQANAKANNQENNNSNNNNDNKNNKKRKVSSTTNLVSPILMESVEVVVSALKELILPESEQEPVNQKKKAEKLAPAPAETVEVVDKKKSKKK